MLTLNVNNTIYKNADSCKLDNLSAQELHDLDIYIMTDSINAQTWLLTTNSDNTPKVQFEVDRFSDRSGNTIAPGQIFNIQSGNPGESFSNPITYSRTDRIVDDHILDDYAHIQMLPSHNAMSQKPIRMIGGSVDSKI